MEARAPKFASICKPVPGTRISAGRSIITLGLVALLLGMLNGCAGLVSGSSPNQTAAFQISPASVSFGKVAVGQQSTQNVSVTNSGKTPLNITQAIFSNPQFSLQGASTPMALAVGQTGNLSVGVKPAATGNLSATLTVQGDGGSSPAVVTLAATAVNSQPQIAASASSINFGTISTGWQTSTTLTLSNTGSADLIISLLTLNGTDFGISGVATPRIIAAGQSTTFTLTFRPSLSGTVSDNLVITSNDPNNPSLTIPMTGTGSSSPVGRLAASPTTVDFGSVAIGSTATKQISLTNTGNKTVQISQIGSIWPSFSVSGITLPVSVTPGQTVVINATFAPTELGSLAGTIAIASDAQDSFVTVNLSGVGVQAGLSVSPATFNFGSVVDGQAKSQSFTLTNTGTAALTIAQLVVAGAGYSLNGLSTPATLAAGQSATFNAVFAPTSAGNLTGSITINSSAANSPLTATLAGTGVLSAASIAANPTSVSFGSISAGSSSSKTVTITNTGTANLTISQITVSGSDLSATGITLPTTLSAGQSSILNLTYAPNSGETLNGSVTIADSQGTSAVVAVSGTGLQAGIFLTPGSVGFGDVVMGVTNSQTVQLVNTGTTVLNVTQLAVTGPGFTTDTIIFPLSINPGQAKNFNVQFSPLSSGSAVGSVTLQSNAPMSPTVLALSGTGVAAVRTLSISATSLNFGNVIDGTIAAQNVTITNTGNADVQITQFGVLGADYGLTSANAPVTLTPSQAIVIGVTFSPIAAGNVSGSITVTSNASGSPVTVTLSGVGVAPSTHTVDLSWTASASTVAGYNIYRSTTSGNGYIKLNGSLLPALTYTDSTLMTSTTYYYVTTAVDGSGNESPYSNEAQAIIP